MVQDWQEQASFKEKSSPAQKRWGSASIKAVLVQSMTKGARRPRLSSLDRSLNNKDRGQSMSSMPTSGEPSGTTGPQPGTTVSIKDVELAARPLEEGPNHVSFAMSQV